MKAFLYKEKNILEAGNVKKPELTSTGAIIKVLGCGVCGSDIVKLREGLAKPDSVLGHEVVGIIEEINSSTDFKLGDRIVLGHHSPCYNCKYCRNKSYSMCREFKSSNIIPGGFCEYIFVSEKHLKDTVQTVPENLSDVQASFTEPVACCHRAVRRANIQEGDTVLIIGLGSIGLLMGQILKYYGAKVIGCDLLEERLNIAQNLGFDEIYKTIPTEMQADKVFLVSGSEKTISLALKHVLDGGTICIFASIPSNETGFPNNEIYYRDLTIFGSYSPASSDLKDALNLLKNNHIKTAPLITEYSLDEINKAIDDTISNKIIKAYIKI
jgi:L-iditol 2-dehydrogenase